MTNITYTECNGIRYPNLALSEQTNYPLGKYANLRLDFMKRHRRGTYTTLFTEGRLNEYLELWHIIVLTWYQIYYPKYTNLINKNGLREIDDGK